MSSAWSRFLVSDCIDTELASHEAFGFTEAPIDCRLLAMSNAERVFVPWLSMFDVIEATPDLSAESKTPPAFITRFIETTGSSLCLTTHRFIPFESFVFSIAYLKFRIGSDRRQHRILF